MSAIRIVAVAKAAESELVKTKGTPQVSPKLASEHAPENFRRQEKAGR